MGVILFHGGYRTATAGKQFERNAARPRKEIQRIRFFEIDQVPNHVEDIFLGEIRCRTCRKSGRNLETPVSIFSSYDSHVARAIKSNGACIKAGPNV